ncbi:unnamed protein product [Schistosoma curassoni]|uniref:Protein kinase domain-containing protein n=1 Tax=Schistosoma curassoni TaxID=6186 RepID=A0A183KD94_9TREM|nr:unnamed protein product [Schistosoma curassoni]
MIHIPEAETCVLDSTGWARQLSRANRDSRSFVRVLRVIDPIDKYAARSYLQSQDTTGSKILDTGFAYNSVLTVTTLDLIR